MWHFLSVLLLVLEAMLLTIVIVGRCCKKKLNETFVFLGLVFLMNLALYLVPLLHGIIGKETDGNIIFNLLSNVKAAFKLFLGDAETDLVKEFAKEIPVYSVAYLLGLLLAVFATVSTALEAFGTRLRNHFRVLKAMKQPTCDIVLHSGENSLLYAKNSGAVVLLAKKDSKEQALALLEEGYTVLRRDFTTELLSDLWGKGTTRYNLICPSAGESALSALNTFVEYHKQAKPKHDRLHLYLEIDPEKAETICREIIDKNKLSSAVTTFCTDALLARDFMENNPITAFLPDDFFCADASIAEDARIHIVMLGYGKLSRALYRQSVMSNQMVSFRDGQYRVHPVQYSVYDQDADGNDWILGGLKKKLGTLTDKDLFPLPDLPWEVRVENRDPKCRDTLEVVCSGIGQENSYTWVIVDTGDDYSSIETGARLRAMLEGKKNFHLFVRSNCSFTENDPVTTYYGDYAKLFTHDVIVNDSLSKMARRVNEIYTGDIEKAAGEWEMMDHFTRQSNICAAENLRLKLNLLGLNYVPDGKKENLDRIDQAYPRKYPKPEDYPYAEYFERNIRNALLAQEHARWNAYHLVNEFMPMGKNSITVKSNDGSEVRFHTKNLAARKHACLTTFSGLDSLHTYLAKTAHSLTGVPCAPAQYECYQYDEMLINGAKELLESMGCSVTDR